MFLVAEDFNLLPWLLQGLTGEGALNTFPDFVDEQEEEKLRELLGNLFYSAMAAAINALPDDWEATSAYAINDEVVYNGSVWKALAVIAANSAAPVEGANWHNAADPLVDRWIRLRDGEDYQYPDNSPTYNWVGMVKLLKPAIYSLWISANVRMVQKDSVTVANNENAESVNPGIDISKGWNKYKKIAVGVAGRLQWNWCDYSYENTLYGYLTSVSTDFDDVVTDGSFTDFLAYLQQQFKSPGRMNIFDI